jgi:excinuclease ABC subunit C
LFLNGKTVEVKKELKSSMQSAAKSKHFELAARLRDELKALELLEQRQLAQFPNKVNYDFISLANKGALYCVNLFKVRDGKLTDKENFAYSTPKAATELSTSAAHAGQEYRRKIIQTFTSNYYIDATDLPDKVLLQDAVEDPLLIEQLLKHRKNKIVKVEVPKRGKAHQLVLLGQTNAEEYLRKQLATDANDLDKLKEALATLQTALALPTLPRRIECYDMSNTQGTNPVGSMVVFIDGKPAKSEYRKFKIRSKDTPDDFAMMRETLTRRLGRLIDPDKPWPKPDLIVIDGGKGQLSAALDAQMSFLEANSFKLEAISMIGLAKRIEEIFLPNNPEPIILSHTEPALQMLQRLRDEAHRFGITFHRQLRSKQATKSALDSIPGVGPKTKKLLKQKFGTVANVKAASLEDLAAVVGAQKAETIKKNL